jgi:hypothetical protein
MVMSPVVAREWWREVSGEDQVEKLRLSMNFVSSRRSVMGVKTASNSAKARAEESSVTQHLWRQAPPCPREEHKSGRCDPVIQVRRPRISERSSAARNHLSQSSH